ncbi:hypothetical protein MAR_036255, partial [Mya arenaria]
SFHIDIIGLCETFLTPSVHDNELVIPGYSFVRKDRLDKGGGVKKKQVKNSHDSITYRCYKGFDEDLFKADLVNSNLILIDSIADPNFALDIFYDTIHTALSDHTTIKQKRIKHARIIIFCTKILKITKKTRNKISSMIRKSKKSFYNDAIKNNKSSKFLWQNLNDITNNNKAHQFSIPNKLIINEKDIE